MLLADHCAQNVLSVEGTPAAAKARLDEKRARTKRAQNIQEEHLSQIQGSGGQTRSHLPNPADCIDCREMSAVEAMPCIRSLNSSAFEAFSRAVS